MIDTQDCAEFLSDLRKDCWHIVAERKRIHLMGAPWSYFISTSEVKQFHRDRDVGKIISAQRLDGDRFVVVAKLARG